MPDMMKLVGHIRAKRSIDAPHATTAKSCARQKNSISEGRYRTLLFDPAKVEKALQRFEIPAVREKCEMTSPPKKVPGALGSYTGQN